VTRAPARTWALASAARTWARATPRGVPVKVRGFAWSAVRFDAHHLGRVLGRPCGLRVLGSIRGACVLAQGGLPSVPRAEIPVRTRFFSRDRPYKGRAVRPSTGALYGHHVRGCSGAGARCGCSGAGAPCVRAQARSASVPRAEIPVRTRFFSGDRPYKGRAVRPSTGALYGHHVRGCSGAGARCGCSGAGAPCVRAQARSASVPRAEIPVRTRFFPATVPTRVGRFGCSRVRARVARACPTRNACPAGGRAPARLRRFGRAAVAKVAGTAWRRAQQKSPTRVGDVGSGFRESPPEALVCTAPNVTSKKCPLSDQGKSWTREKSPKNGMSRLAARRKTCRQKWIRVKAGKILGSEEKALVVIFFEPWIFPGQKKKMRR
jgi:hypothetical protein